MASLRPLSLLGVSLFAGSALAQTVTVSPANTQGWFWGGGSSVAGRTSTALAVIGEASFTPILGDGVAMLMTGSGVLFNSYASFSLAIDRKALNGLLVLNYKSIVLPGSEEATEEDRQYGAYIVLGLDENGDGAIDARLVYEPRFNGTLKIGKWQAWNAAQGLWWTTRSGEADHRSLATWSSVLAKSRVVQMDVTVGGGTKYAPWNHKACAFDAVTVRWKNNPLVTYDFEARG